MTWFTSARGREGVREWGGLGGPGELWGMEPFVEAHPAPTLET